MFLKTVATSSAVHSLLEIQGSIQTELMLSGQMQALTGGESRSTAGICWTMRSLQLGVRARAALMMHVRQASEGYWAETVTVDVARTRAKADATMVEKCIVGIFCWKVRREGWGDVAF
jgi:hypothetical protein